MTDMTIGQRIGEQRRKLGLSQEALGEKMGVSRQAISKWEADSAIPEIDKLIAMSRLFGVSVGWLLGVEERQTPQEDTLSDKQLEIMEQILSKYQQPVPQPQNANRWWKLLAVAGIAAAVIMAAVALNRASVNIPDYEFQFSNLSGKYANLQSQLGQLSDQLNTLVEGEKLLSEYQFYAAANQELSGALVTFSAAPKRWQPEDQGMLSVRLNGEEVRREVCGWNGSTCTARLELPAADGYSYYFVVSHSDGTQEQEGPLTGHAAGNIADGLKVSCDADFGWTGGRKSLELFSAFVLLSPPYLLEGRDSLVWETADLVFLLEGEEVQRLSILTAEDMFPEDTAMPEWVVLEKYGGDLYRRVRMNLSFHLEEGQRLEARLIAKTDSGMEVNTVAAAWVNSNGAVSELRYTE